MAVYIISGKIISFMYSPKLSLLRITKNIINVMKLNMKSSSVMMMIGSSTSSTRYSITVEKSVTVSNEHIYDHKRAYGKAKVQII